MSGSLIGNLAVLLSMETSAFEKGANHAQRLMAKTQRSFEQMGQRIGAAGRTLSLTVTAPLAALAVTSVKAAQESAQAMGQVDAALKSMGDGAGRTREQLQALASNQMRQSLFDDDDILRKVTANLLTFGSVAGEQFDRAQQAAIDLAARMGTDLQSATIMIGKALNDPAKGLASLRRVGIQFTEQQQDQIKAMSAAGNAAGAQSIMLAELERQFGGSAAAMRAADPAAAMKQSWAEFQETLGEKLLPLLPRITEALTKVLDVFGKLSPGMQTAVIVVGGLAAALGPVLMGVGALVSGVGALLPVLVSLAPAFGPILLGVAAVAAAGYLIYQNWDKIAPVLAAVRDRFAEVLGPKLQSLIETVKATLEKLWNGPFGDGLRAVMALLAQFGAAYASVFGESLIRALGAAIEIVEGAFAMIGAAIGFVVALLTGDFAGAWESAKAFVAAAVSTIIDVFESLFPGISAEVQKIYNGVKTWLSDKLGAVFDWVKGKIELVGAAFAWLYDVVVGNSYVPDMVDGIAAEMARLDAVMVEPARKGAKAVADAMREAAEEVRALLDELFPEQAEDRAYEGQIATASRILDPAARASAQAALARQRDEQLKARGAGGPGVLGKAGGDPGTKSWAAEIVLEEQFQKVLEGLDEMGERAKETTVRIAKSFKDMVEETSASIQRMVGAIKGGGFFDILDAAVGLFMQLGSIGAFGKGIAGNINATVPARAIGGPVVGGRQYLVGERGPELFAPRQSGSITPNHRLGGGGGAMKLVVEPSELFHTRLVEVEDRAAVRGATGGLALSREHFARSAQRRLGRG